MTDTRLDGSVAVVTGASSGIGEAAAESLAGLGAKVALVARRADRLEALATRITDSGGTALVVEADVTGREAAESAVARTVAELGGLDIVINNAGVMLLGPMADAPVEEWERMVHLNVMGAMYVAKAALPHLLEAAAGGPRQVADIVHVSSVAGRVVRSGSGVYNASKHALGAFSEGMRQEFTARGLRSSLVEPGATATELASHNREEVQEGLRQRFGGITRLEAQDIADVITFVVTRPRHVAVNEILVRPTDQEG
jgi:NADP-dependent 3-hydroxy acid dehydrogenase YdfG